MTTIRPEGLSMAGCLLLSGMICIAQIMGNSILLLGLLIAFLLLLVWTGENNLVLPVLLYFLPWSPLLKLYSGSFSFFTIGLLTTCVYYQIKTRFSLKLYQIVLPMLLMIITLVGKLLQGNYFSMEYIFFFSMMVFFPCVTRNNTRKDGFWNLCFFFALGIISAALSAQYAAKFPNIMQYIKVESYHTVTRLSGYYGDPNYYAAHITACVAGILLLLIQEKNRLKRVSLYVLLSVLIYCGLLSASKSFALVSAAIFLTWIPILLEHRGRGGNLFRITLGLLCAGLVIVVSPLFQELIRILDDRFSYAANMSQFTTGRTDIWVEYLHELGHNPLLLLFGEGYTSVLLFRKVAHNSLIQTILQFGLIGTPVLAVWLFYFLRDSESDLPRGKKKATYALVMLAGVVGPWLALDILFFDEFFLMPVFLVFGVQYATSSE